MGAATAEYQFKPHERPTIPGSPATPDHPTPRRVGYFCVGVLIGLTAGFGNALVLANLNHIQGVFGLYSDQAAWLSTVYVMTNVCMSMLLIKFRQQYGLQHFARLFLLGYVAVSPISSSIPSKPRCWCARPTALRPAASARWRCTT
ncbi:hypothetical protein [Cupriavidus gilardii]|uniref:hypothetical protein n=1 Tax=Cupriavidus gilardii TaxID=82541 RepID=UPI001EE5AB13|nr:hypothetical protein [Cupriavidus gilardii]MCG5259057.1 hypothetical protein [Cupriavidus gilardii]